MLKQGGWLVLSCTTMGKGGIWSYCFSSFWCPSDTSDNASWSRGVAQSFQKWNETDKNKDAAKMVWDTSALVPPCRIWVTAWKQLGTVFWVVFPVMFLFWIYGTLSKLVGFDSGCPFLRRQCVCRHWVKSILLRWIVVDCRHQLGEKAGTGWRPASKEKSP